MKTILKITTYIILSLLLSMTGILIHNYEVNKCEIVSQNQYYEAQSNCYMTLYLPNWNLFGNIFIMFIMTLIILGVIWFAMEEIFD